MELMAATSVPGHGLAMSIPDASGYMSSPYDGSTSFGDMLHSSLGGLNYRYQSPPLLASTATTLKPSPAVADKEPMYVHLPQFWDRSSAVCPSQVVCGYDISAAVAAKASGTLATFASVDTEVKSECSTADTSDHCLRSPELEPARPRTVHGSQQLAMIPQFGDTELDKEFKQVPSRPWHSRLGHRAAEAKHNEAQQGPLPSMGSAGHRSGRCKPCAFVGTKGCNSGADCRFCHLCEAGEKKKRQKEKRAHFTAIRHARQAQNAQANVQVAAQMNVVPES